MVQAQRLQGLVRERGDPVRERALRRGRGRSIHVEVPGEAAGAAAAVVLLGNLLWTLRLHCCRQHHFFQGLGGKKVADKNVRDKHSHLLLPCLALFTSACLVIAYSVRAIGTKNQQEPAFVAVSDTLVLLCPMRMFLSMTHTQSLLRATSITWDPHR